MHFIFCKTHNFLNTTEQRLDGTDGTNKIIMIGLLLIIQNQMPVQTQRARYMLQMTAKYLVKIIAQYLKSTSTIWTVVPFRCFVMVFIN